MFWRVVELEGVSPIGSIFLYSYLGINTLRKLFHEVLPIIYNSSIIIECKNTLFPRNDQTIRGEITYFEEKNAFF